MSKLEYHYFVLFRYPSDKEIQRMSVFSDNPDRKELFKKAIAKFELPEEDTKDLEFVGVESGILLSRKVA